MRGRKIKSGERFGSLVCMRPNGKAADGHIKWLCRCDCGRTCTKQSNSLRTSERSGSQASCGCVSDAENRRRATRHGMRGTREYDSWRSAIERCHNPNSKDHHRYGAIGVRVCDEWRSDFEAFHRDMGERPEGTTLDRWPDKDGDYKPGNCRWATAKEQANNRRVTVFVSAPNGEHAPLSQVASEIGITYGAAFMRLQRGKLDGYRRV